MLRRLILCSLTLALCATCQIGGGYPGQGPSIPFPRRNKNKKDAKKPDELLDLKTLKGSLRRLETEEIIIETPDHRIVRMGAAATTKFLKEEAEIKSADLNPGDHLVIEASQDDRGYFHAVKVTLEKAGSPGERAAAQAPVEALPRISDDEPAPRKLGGDDDRPVMRRASKSEEASAASAPAARAPAPAPAPAPEEEKTAEIHAIEKAPADDDARPHVKRGKPAPRKPSSEPEDQVAVASIGPAPEPARLPEARAIERAPAAAVDSPRSSVDPIIDKARDMALNFVETLPNYMVKQFTTRFVSVSKNEWKPQDTISTDLVYEDGREHYRNILLNGKPAKGKIEETGSWSTGEFGTVLRDLFSPSTNADFRPNGSPVIAHRTTRAFTFVVEQENSHWQVVAAGQTYKPAYRGTVWIDKDTARVLRIEMQTRNMPKEFPIDTVESATDYEFVRIGATTAEFLLPTHSESLSCIRGTSQCSKNVIDFRNYRKFGAESDIKYAQ